MHIRDWPEAERPSEKLLARGPGALSDAELLALFLGSGLRGRDAVTTARELLSAHGPLRRLLDRPAAELARLPGLGAARACTLSAALELGQRHLHAALERGEALSDPAAAGRYFAHRLRGLAHEVFAALFLDTRHRVIAYEALFSGTVDGTEVHPREVVRRALAHNAAAVIVALTVTCDCSDIAESLVQPQFLRRANVTDVMSASMTSVATLSATGTARAIDLRLTSLPTDRPYGRLSRPRITSAGQWPNASTSSMNSITSSRRAPASTAESLCCGQARSLASCVWDLPCSSLKPRRRATSSRYAEL